MSKSHKVTKQQLKSLENEKKNSVEEIHEFKPKGRSWHKKPKRTFNQSTLKPHDSKMEPDQTPKETDGKGKTPSKGKCKYCGNQMHRKRRDCPAFGQVCRKCNKSNHFASVCNAKRSNSVNVGLNEDNSDSDLSVLQVETASILARKGKQVLTELRTQTTLSTRNPWFVSWTLEHCVTWSAIETSQFFYRTGSLN